MPPRKSRHAWFTSTRDVMSPSPPREMDTVLPPLLIISEIDTILPLSYFLWSQVITKYQHLISLSYSVLRISPFPTRPVPVPPLLLLDLSRRFYYYYYHNSMISLNWIRKSLKWASDMKKNRKIRPKQWVTHSILVTLPGLKKSLPILADFKKNGSIL